MADPTPTTPAIPEVPPSETAFFDSIGRDLQLALTSNDTEPMALRIERLKGVQRALADMDELTPNQAILQAQMIVGHYLVMGCAKGVGEAARDSATASRLRANAATLMRAVIGTAREIDRTQANPPTGAKGARSWNR